VKQHLSKGDGDTLGSPSRERLGGNAKRETSKRSQNFNARLAVLSLGGRSRKGPRNESGQG